MTLRIVALSIMAVLMMLLAGCGDRENPADIEDIAHGTIYMYPLKFNHIEYNETGMENWVHYRQRPFLIYTPPGYVADPPGEGPKFPVLYLLHDFTSYSDSNTAFLFANIGLVADKMIADGEIVPMVIVMPDASTPVGGSFYQDGWGLWNRNESAKKQSGNFEKMIYRDLVNYTEVQAYPYEMPFSIIRKRASRGIAGFGMGGYGALMIAMKHPDLFGSVSLLDGFTSVEENIDGLIAGIFDENNVAAGDMDSFLDIDSSFFRPNTNLALSMATAFSQHDSLGTDDATYLPKFGVDLPFDENGDLVQEKWQLWLDKDITASLLDLYYMNLESTSVYFRYSAENQYHTAQQAAACIAKLQSLGITDIESESYQGYEGFPATHGAFTYEQIGELLKFHSRHLDTDPGE
ncbi:MAG: alpha/beta hydrolase-fold protein [Candidatus Zixiibacteriota bacterium]